MRHLTRRTRPTRSRSSSSPGPKLRVAGLSYREIAQQLGCGRGTVERAVRNTSLPKQIIRSERLDGRPTITIDVHPFPWHDAPEVTEWSPTGAEWGYFGAGSKRLAFTILLAVTDRHEFYKFAPWFAQGCLERIGPERQPWALTTDEVRDCLAGSREMKAQTDEAATAGGQAGATLTSVTVTPGRTRFGGPHHRVRRSVPRTGHMIYCQRVFATHRLHPPPCVQR